MADARGLAGNRVAIVTGGSRGIGREAVHRLASLGYALVVNYLHDQPTAESTVEAILDNKGTAVAIRADVSDDLDVERLFHQAVETFGAVDAVVHAVRGQVSAVSAADVTPAEFDLLLLTTVRATFGVNRAAAQCVRNGGAIINLVGSVSSALMPAYGAYAVTATAIDKLTRALAIDLRHRDITVNGVSLHMDKPCAPGRVADVIAFLLSDEGHDITGQVMHLDQLLQRPESE